MKRVKNEKRTGPDGILNLISGICAILWIIFVIVFVLFIIANPTHSATSLSRPGLKGSGRWAVNVIYILLIAQTFLSVSGIIFNLTRMKRKTDSMRLTLVFFAILGIAGIIMMKI